MILVDTSVWIDHLRASDPTLSQLLDDGQVLAHPFIIGELACGNLANRGEILTLLEALPSVSAATDTEARGYIESQHLMGRGIGYIDVHLLASAALEPDATLWTRHVRLRRVALLLGLATDSIA